MEDDLRFNWDGIAVVGSSSVSEIATLLSLFDADLRDDLRDIFRIAVVQEGGKKRTG